MESNSLFFAIDQINAFYPNEIIKTLTSILNVHFNNILFVVIETIMFFCLNRIGMVQQFLQLGYRETHITISRFRHNSVLTSQRIGMPQPFLRLSYGVSPFIIVTPFFVRD